MRRLDEDDPLDDFERRELTLEGATRRVFVAGNGPAVIVMAELPGISPHVARFARWVRDAGFTDPLTVGWIMSAAYLCGGAGMILNGRHSDRTGEARLHCGVPAFIGALAIALTGVFVTGAPILALIMLGLAVVGTMSAIPVFWQIPGRFLAGSAAAAGIALISSIGITSGIVSPWVIGMIRTRTGSMDLAVYLLAALLVASGVALMLGVKGEAAPRH